MQDMDSHVSNSKTIKNNNKQDVVAHDWNPHGSSTMEAEAGGLLQIWD